MLFHVNVLKSCGAKIETNPEIYLHYIQGLASYTEYLILQNYSSSPLFCDKHIAAALAGFQIFSLSQDHHNLMYLDVDLQYQYICCNNNTNNTLRLFIY